MREQALLFQPKCIIAGGSAYPRDWNYKIISEIAKEVGAFMLTDMAHISGLVATQNANNPFEYSDIVTTTTHKSLRGPRSGMIFCKKEFTEKIDSAVFPSLQGGPHNNVIAAVAVSLKEALQPDFTEYINNVKSNAELLSQKLIANEYKLCTNGTDNHLLLIDLRNKGITGSKAEYVLEKVGISVNKNSVIGDKSALSPGGLRIGLCAMTSRGLNKAHIDELGELIHRGLQIGIELQKGFPKLIDFKKEINKENNTINKLKNDVIIFSKQFHFNYRIS